MRNSKRNGFIKSLTSVIAVVLMLALMLTGCTDKEAQSLANTAQGAADKAQASADKANSNAASAQDKADGNEAKLTELEKLVKSLPDSEAVAEAISNTLNQYVKGEGALVDESIVTYNEVMEILKQYVTAQALEGKLKDVDDKLVALESQIKNELQKAIDKNAEDIKANSSLIKDNAGDIKDNADNIKDNADAIVKINKWIDGAAKTIVESKEFEAAVEAALADYVTTETFGKGIDEVKEDIEDVNEAVAELKKLLVGANYNDDTAENLIGKINNEISTLKAKIGTLETKVNVEIPGALKDLGDDLADLSDKLDDTKTELEAAIKDAIKEHESQFLAATEFIIANDAKFDELLAKYAALENVYPEKTYNAIVNNINENRVRFRRALNVSDAQKILDTVTSEAAEEINLAQVLANALDEVYYVDGYVVIEDLTGKDDKNSRTGYEAAMEILTVINGRMSAEEIATYVNAYNDANTGKIRDLAEEVAVLKAEVELLDAIKDYAAKNVITAFTGIANYDKANKNFASVKVDEAEKWFGDGVLRDRDTLVTEKGMADTALATYIETQFAGDDKNPNITRLVTADAWTQYEAAATRLNELAHLDEDAAAWATAITTELAKYAYTSNGRTCYLYSDYAALNGYKNGDLKAFLDANFAATDDATVDAVIGTYSDVLYAVDYSNDMKVNFADTAEPVIELLQAVIDCNNVYSPENAALTKKANLAYLAWGYQNTATKYEFVDDKNHDAILGAEIVEKYPAAADTMRILENAAKNAVAINEKIKDLVKLMDDGKLSIYTMSAEDGIREVRNDIVAWLNAASIAAPEATEENAVLINWIKKTLATEGEFDTVQYAVTSAYIAENWAMLKSAEFISVINAYDAIVKDAIDDANKEGGVIELIDAIKADDTKILYQSAAIKAARAAYNLWVGHNNIGVADLSKFDLGETYKADKDLIVAHAMTLVAAEHALDIALVSAKADYAAMTDLAEALKESYTVTIFAKKIPDSYNLAVAWYEKYIDETRGFNDVIKAIEGILTEEEYDAICAKFTAYDNLVKAAVADVAEMKTALENIDAKFTVYSYTNINTAVALYNAFVTAYGAEADDLANADLDARLAHAKAICDAILAADTNYGTFINNLKTAADAIVNKYNATFTDSYVYTIYSRTDIQPIRDAYDAWAESAGMVNTTGAYTDADAGVQAYKAFLEKIIASETTITNLETQKNTETTALKNLIAGLNNIGGADKVTILNADQIEAVVDALYAWIAGDFNADGEVTAEENAVYAIVGDLFTGKYSITEAEWNLVLAYTAAINEIYKKIELVEDLVKDFEDGVTAEELEKAKDALEDLYENNGGKNNGAVSAEIVATIAKAEMTLALESALAEVEKIAGLDKVASPVADYANYKLWLIEELKTACKEAIADLDTNAELKADFEGGNDTAYQSVADQLNGLFGEYIDDAEAAVKTNA